MPDLAAVIRQAEKLRELTQPKSPSPRKDKGEGLITSSPARDLIRYEVVMTAAQLRQIEELLSRLRGEVMTPEDLAQYLQISVARSGEIPGTKIGRKWRFKKSQIDCWLEDNAATARKDATK